MATTKKYVSFDKLGLYDDKIKAYLADADAVVLQGAKDYADSLGDNYEAAGTVSSVKTELEGKITTAQSTADEAKSAAGTNAAAITELQTAVAAKADASALAELDAYVGDIPSDEAYADITTVIGYVNKKSEEVLSQASGGSSESAASVLAALNTYKSENDPKVTKNTEDIAALQTSVQTAQSAADEAQAHSEGVASDLAEAVEALESADASQVGRIAALEGTIVGLSGAMHFEGVKDEVPTDVTGYEQGDVIIVGNKEYVFNDGAFVEFGDASVNAEAITALTGRMDAVDTKIEGIEGDIADLETAVAAKAEQSAVDEAVAALEAVDEGFETRIAAVEAELAGEGEGTVAEQISAAKQEAIDAAAAAADTKDAAILAEAKKYADDEDAKIESRVDALETASATHALASDVTAVAGRVTTLEGSMTQAQADIDAVEVVAADNAAAITALQTAVAGKASQTDLEAAVARIAANETAIAAFVEVSEEEINALFATETA